MYRNTDSVAELLHYDHHSANALIYRLWPHQTLSLLLLCYSDQVAYRFPANGQFFVMITLTIAPLILILR